MLHPSCGGDLVFTSQIRNVYDLIPCTCYDVLKFACFEISDNMDFPVTIVANPPGSYVFLLKNKFSLRRIIIFAKYFNSKWNRLFMRISCVDDYS